MAASPKRLSRSGPDSLDAALFLASTGLARQLPCLSPDQPVDLGLWKS